MGGQGSHASHKAHKIAPVPAFFDLNCTLSPTPNPKPHLNASSKPEAEHEPSTLTNLALADRSLIPFNSKPKTQKLKLNPKPQNPTTTPHGEEGPHTPHHYPDHRPLGRGGGGGEWAASEHVTMYVMCVGTYVCMHVRMLACMDVCMHEGMYRCM